MSKLIQLHIPEPCHENWDKMTPVVKGKFCDSCQKQVVDFTGMSDTQLVAFFRKPTTGSVCGRFLQHQLNRDVEIPKKRIPWVKYFFQFALPAFMMTSKAYAQGKVRTIKRNTTSVTEVKKDNIKADSKTSLPETHKLIRGRIVDEINEGVPYATVLIKGTTSVTAADSSGFFKLKYRGKEDEIVLASSYLGFEGVEIPIDTRNSDKPFTIVMQKNAMILDEVTVQAFQGALGSVVLGGINISNKDVEEINVIDTLSKILFPKNTIENVYPNPVKSNSTIKIKLGKYKEGMYLMELINLTGQVVSKKEVWLDKNSYVIELYVPSVAAGTYFVKIINKQSGKITAEKIIVE